MQDRPLRLTQTALAILLSGLCLHSALFHPPHDLDRCLDTPADCEGQLIGVGHETRARNIGPDGFDLARGRRLAHVTGYVPGLGENDYVEIEGIFHGSDRIEMLRYAVRDKRRMKMYASLLPCFFVAWLFLRAFTWDRSNWCVRRR